MKRSHRRRKAHKPRRRFKKKFFIVLILILGIAVFIFSTMKPSNNRDWSPDQAILAYATIKANLITVHNIRNFTYRSTTDYTPGYYDATYDLTKLKKMYFIDEPFSGYVGAAHTFLSFEFEGNKFLSISIEIRKEKGESFSAVKGLFNQYEIMYVAADERDVIKLRSNIRNDKVYLYPLKASPGNAQKIFLSMINKMNELRTKPEFYNTITNNCTNTIAKFANEASPGKVPWNYTFIFPSNADNYAFDLGLIDTTEKNFEAVRSSHLINTLAEQYANSPEFSLKIRGR
jgi:hypothetical protein